jgi:hypothetical protein
MKRNQALQLGTVTALAVAFAGCGGDDQVAYCTSQDGTIVESRYCDDDSTSGFYYWYFANGGHTYTRGQRVAAGALAAKGARIQANNTKALTAKGYSASRGGFGGSARAVGVSVHVSGGS